MYDLILPRSSSDLSSFSSDGDGGAESDATSGGTFSDVWASKEEGLDQIANGGRKLTNGRRELELEDLMMEVERGCRLADEDSPNAARVVSVFLCLGLRHSVAQETDASSSFSLSRSPPTTSPLPSDPSPKPLVLSSRRSLSPARSPSPASRFPSSPLPEQHR